MALNTVVAGRAWLYSHTIGRQAQIGMGFTQPIGICLRQQWSYLRCQPVRRGYTKYPNQQSYLGRTILSMSLGGGTLLGLGAWLSTKPRMYTPRTNGRKDQRL